MATTPKNFIITGTSGTGKTVLIEELRRRSFAVFDEAQRATLTEQLAIDGPALPVKNPAKFIQALLEHCAGSLEESKKFEGPVFFDRGIPDVAAYAIRFGVDPAACHLAAEGHEYNHHVFVLPPWKEIFVPDALRGKSFEEYLEFHSVIAECYEDFGFKLLEVPFCSIDKRANFVLETIEGFID